MKNDNKPEVILFSKYPLESFAQTELVSWLFNTLPQLMSQQEDAAEKLFLKTLKDMPAIYLS
jgi:hypothetical protein